MPIQSRWSIPTPQISLPTWVFGSEQYGPRNEKIAFVDAGDPNNTLTIREFEIYSKRLAVGLRRLGVKPGDRVLVFFENGIFAPCLFFGIIMAGAICTVTSSSSTSLELSYQLKDSGVVGTNVQGHEVPRAYVAWRPGSCLTAHNIMSWMETKVASYKRLEGGIVFVNDIPRTQSGKILRRILRDRAKKEAKGFIPMKAKLA